MNTPKNQKRLTLGDLSGLEAACRELVPSATGLMAWVGTGAGPGKVGTKGKGAAVPVNRLEPLAVVAGERLDCGARFRPIALHQRHLLVEVIDEPTSGAWLVDASAYVGPSNSSGWSV